MADEPQAGEAGAGNPATLLADKKTVEGDPNAAAAAAAAKAEDEHLFTLALDAKPDGIPDHYWDAEGKKLKLGAMHKALTDTQTALRNKQPKAPDKYEPKIPEELIGKIELDPEGEGLKAFNEIAKKHTLSQEAYNEFLGIYLKEIAGQAPDPEKLKEQAAEYRATLAGPNYFGSEAKRDASLAALETYLSAHLTDDEYQVAREMASSPMQVKVLHKLRILNKETAIPDARDTSRQNETITEESLRQMVADERYETTSPKHDPIYRQMVSRKFSEFYNK